MVNSSLPVLLYHKLTIHFYYSIIRSYIIYGVITVAIGALTFFCLVDDPHHKLLRLTEKEKEIVEDRSNDNRAVRNKEIKRDQIREAVKEARLWIVLFVFFLNNLQNGGIVTFSTLLVRGLGFNVSNEHQSILRTGY